MCYTYLGVSSCDWFFLWKNNSWEYFIPLWLSEDWPCTLQSSSFISVHRFWAYVLKPTSTFMVPLRIEFNRGFPNESGKTLSCQIDEWGNGVFYTWIKLTAKEVLVLLPKTTRPSYTYHTPMYWTRPVNEKKKKKKNIIHKEFNFHHEYELSEF